MKKIASVVCLSTACFAGAASANEGGYIGLSAGQSSSDYAGSKNPVALALQLGYQANENFALEFQYGAFGNIAPVGSEKITSISLAGLGLLPVTERFSVFAKLGVASVATKISGSGIFDVNGISADGTYRKTSPTYGIGGDFMFSPRFGVRFGVDRYSTGGSKDSFLLNNGTLNVMYVGVKFGF